MALFVVSINQVIEKTHAVLSHNRSPSPIMAPGENIINKFYAFLPEASSVYLRQGVTQKDEVKRRWKLR